MFFVRITVSAVPPRFDDRRRENNTCACVCCAKGAAHFNRACGDLQAILCKSVVKANE